MAKKKLSEHLLGKVEPTSVKSAAVGAFLSFFVYAGVLFTFEPLFSAYVGSNSVFLYADDEDLGQARRSAESLQRQIEHDRAVKDFVRRQAANDDAYYARNPPRQGQTRIRPDGSVERRVGNRWECFINCKPKTPEHTPKTY